MSDVGIRNADLRKSIESFKQGHTWKRQRIILLLPAGRDIPTRVVASLLAHIRLPNQPFWTHVCEGEEVGKAYSDAIAGILAHPELSKWEYVLTWEHDNLPPVDGTVKLVKRMEERKDLAAISGLYWTKWEGGVPQIWGDVADPMPNSRPQPPVLGKVVDCWGVGMGFTLYRLKMFKDERLRKPWFKTVNSTEEGVGTQDLYFWGDARKYGYKCGVDCDVRVGHLDRETGLVW